MLGISEDITERKQSDEARIRFIREQAHLVQTEKAKKRSDFLSEASKVMASILDPHSVKAQLKFFRTLSCG